MIEAESYVREIVSERTRCTHDSKGMVGLRKLSEEYEGNAWEEKQADRHFRRGAEHLSCGRYVQAKEEILLALETCPEDDKKARKKIEALLRIATEESSKIHEGSEEKKEERDRSKEELDG